VDLYSLLVYMEHIHYTFKPNDVFLESTLPKETKLENRLKLGFTAQDILWAQSSVSRSWQRKTHASATRPLELWSAWWPVMRQLMSMICYHTLTTTLSYKRAYVQTVPAMAFWPITFMLTRESILHRCSSSQLVLTLLPFHCAWSWHYLHCPNIMALFTLPKHKL